MRLKGINPFEQHAEKFVAGLFALGLLGVVAMQFLGKPSKVKVGTEEVNPAEAYEAVARNARKVDDSMKRPQDPPEGMDKVADGFKDFDKRLIAPVSPSPQLAGPLDKTAPIGIGTSGVQNANAPMNELVIPAPAHALAAINMSTVSSSEQAVPEVAKVLPATAPFDKASVTVEATFDGTLLKKALALDPDDAGPIRPIPATWYSSGVQIIGVELHRQMRTSDGTWSAAETVKQIPGRALFVDGADKLNDAASLKTATTFATENAEFVRRTPYYTAMFGEKWASPSERASTVDVEGDKTAQIANTRKELQTAERALKALQDQLAKVGQPNAPAGGGGAGGGAVGGGPKGGGGGGSGGAPPPPSGPNAGDEARKRQLGTAITKQQEKITQIKDKLRALGATVEGDTTQPTVPDPTMKPKQEPAVIDNAAIKLWAHDVFVERGKTYRYQVVAIITNPYFGHSPAMVPAQAEKLAKAGIIRSPASEWTDPITVDPETLLFFTAATQDDPAAGRSATARAEVFQFKWGFWRRGAATLEPGDSVIAEIRVPDFAKILSAAPADPNRPPAAPNPPTAPIGGGGKGGVLGGGGLGNSPPVRPDAPIIPATPPPMVMVPVDSNQIMLGVGSGPIRDAAGKAKPVPQVYIREPDGEIKVIIPDAEKSDDTYTRVNRSAEKGLKELTPSQDKNKPLPTVPNPTGTGSTPPQGQGGRGG